MLFLIEVESEKEFAIAVGCRRIYRRKLPGGHILLSLVGLQYVYMFPAWRPGQYRFLSKIYAKFHCADALYIEVKNSYTRSEYFCQLGLRRHWQSHF